VGTDHQTDVEIRRGNHKAILGPAGHTRSAWPAGEKCCIAPWLEIVTVHFLYTYN